jgi:glycosyltransferase involved in cell wall biosynthesis
MLLYSILLRRNRVIYHTSWPYWDLDSTPRQYGAMNTALRRLWVRVLVHSNVTVVCILEETKRELKSRFDIDASVVPHAVPDLFFDARADERQPGPLRLLFVGSLTTRKGVLRILEIMSALEDCDVVLTVVGDGPLRERCVEASRQNSAIRYMGPIHERGRLAQEMATHDILLVLSVKDSTWEELFGIVIAEASASGLGVIASDHIGPRSMLANLESGNLFPDNDNTGPADLARRLAASETALRRFKAAHGGLAESYREGLIANKWEDILLNRP